MTIKTTLIPYTIVVTRPEVQAENLKLRLENEGFKCLLFPATRIQPLPYSDKLQSAMDDLAHRRFAWIVFTSLNGVRCFAAAQSDVIGRAAVPRETLIACQGARTAEAAVEVYGRCEFIPERAVLEELAVGLKLRCVAGQRFLLPSAEEGRDVVEKALAQIGVDLLKVAVYRTVTVDSDSVALDSILARAPNELIFTFFSPSSLNSTMELLGQRAPLLAQVKIVTVGPVTTQAVLNHGFNISAESTVQSDVGVVEAVKRVCGQAKL